MKKLQLGFVLLGLLSLTACSVPQPSKIDPLDSYEHYQVTFGDITDTSQYWIGTVEPQQVVTITPEAGGVLEGLYAKVGDEFAMGDTLIQLDTQETVTQAQIADSMADALYVMRDNTSRALDEQIKSMESQLLGAQKQIDIAQTASSGESVGMDDTLRVLEQQLATAQHATSDLETLYQTKQQTITSNIKNALSQAYALNAQIMSMSDSLLGMSVTHEHDNDSFEFLLSAKNAQLKNLAESQRSDLNDRELALKKQYAIIVVSTGAQDQQMVQLLDQSISYMQDVGAFLKTLQQVIEQSVEAQQLPASQIQQYKATISIFQQQIEAVLISTDASNLLGLKGAKQSLDGLQSQYNLDVNKAHEEIKTLEAQITATRNGQGTKVSVSKQQVQLAQEGYNALFQQIEALRQQKQAQLAQIDVQIAQSNGQGRQAQVMVGNATVYAPFNGIVMEKYLDEGSVVGPGVPLLKIGSTDAAVIRINLPSSYRSMIQVGQESRVETSQGYITARVAQVAPAADPSTKTVLIEYSIIGDGEIPLGSYVKVFAPSPVAQDSKDVINTILKVPKSFIRYQYGQAFVWKRDKTTQTASRHSVTIRMCDPSYCTIDQGLKRSDIIIKQ